MTKIILKRYYLDNDDILVFQGVNIGLTLQGIVHPSATGKHATSQS